MLDRDGRGREKLNDLKLMRDGDSKFKIGEIKDDYLENNCKYNVFFNILKLMNSAHIFKSNVIVSLMATPFFQVLFHKLGQWNF